MGTGSVQAAGLQVIAKLLLRVPSPDEIEALRTSGLPLPLPPDLDALARDYTRLFGGLLPGYGLEPPFESVWRGERRVMGEATQEVMAAYAEAGGQLTEAAGLPPDHVGLELSFLAYLMQSRDEALEQGDAEAAQKAAAAEEAFLADHVLQWVPDLCQAVEAADPEGFYGTLAALLYDYLTAL